MHINLPRHSLAHSCFLVTSLEYNYFSRRGKTCVPVNSSNFPKSSLAYRHFEALRGESQGDREPSQLSSAKWWGATGKMKPYYLQRCTAKDQRQWSQGAVRKFWQKKFWQGKNCSESDSAVKEVPGVMVGIPSLEFEAWLGKALSTLAWLWNWPCTEHEVRLAGPFQHQPCIPWEAENSVMPLCDETADVGHFLPLWSTLLELSLS